MPPCLPRLCGRTHAAVRSALRGSAAGRRRATKAAANSRSRRGAQRARQGLHRARLGATSRSDAADARGEAERARSEPGCTARGTHPVEGDSRAAPRAVRARPRAAKRSVAPAARLQPQSPLPARRRAPPAGADHAALRRVRAAAVGGPRSSPGARRAHVRAAPRRAAPRQPALRRAAPFSVPCTPGTKRRTARSKRAAWWRSCSRAAWPC